MELRTIASVVLRWWWASLSSMMPERLQTFLQSEFLTFVFEPADGMWSVRVESVLPWLCRPGPAWDMKTADLHELAANVAKRFRAYRYVACTTVHVPQNLCLLRTVKVPAADWHRMRQIGLLDIEGSTPFDLRNVYVGHGTAVGHDEHFLSVPQVIIKCAYVDPALEAIQRAGLRATRLALLSADSRLRSANMLETEPAVMPARLLWSLGGVAAVVTLILTLAVVARTLDRHHGQLASLSRRVADASAKLSTIREHQSALSRQVTVLDAPRERKARTVDRSAIWLEVTKRLPDHTWLDALTITAADVELSGTSMAANELIEMLSGRGPLGVASFAAPVVREPGAKRERFRLRIRLAHDLVADGSTEVGQGGSR